MSHRMTSVRLSMLAQTSILLQGPSRKSHARPQAIMAVPVTTEGIVRLRVQVAQWADEQPGTELSRLPIPV